MRSNRLNRSRVGFGLAAGIGVACLLAGCATGARSQPGAEPREHQPDDEGGSLESRIEGLRHVDGLLTLHVDDDKGSLLIELPAAGDDGVIGSYIYVESLAGGLGSNPIGLDRGQLGESRLVTIRLLGGKVLIEQENLAFRAQTDNDAERRAVRQSFATSILWAAPVEARADDGRLLVDASSFVLRDAHAIARALRSAGEGTYSLDDKRSALDTGACLGFPDNIELEGILTFSGSEPGFEVRRTAPEPTAVTLRIHHSLIRLPDDGYRTRIADPRMPSFSVDFTDYSAPLDQPTHTSLLVRHRLEKVDPTRASSPVVEPIVYYVDAGAPEPIRSALIEGASWWAEAFEAAGFEDAFRVEVLPEGAHPLDVRYNVIQWVHRATRGWSYGGGVVDPRTGEMLKGHVSLGSLRVRQDRLIFESLAGTDATGTGSPDDPVQLSLARIRQLAAHEVGHTLGFSHNFAGSTWGRASVMDYPAPLIGLSEAGLDFSDVYGVGIGEWDNHAVRFAYAQFEPGTEEKAELESIVREGQDRGYVYLSDADARSIGAANPAAALWDNGDDPVAALQHSMEVRQIAMSDFGERNVKPGTPLAELQDVFVPLYLHHRYQIDAAAKVVGGVRYAYASRGDGAPPVEVVSVPEQSEALRVLLQTLEPRELDIPPSVAALLLPQTYAPARREELFNGSTDPMFDPVGAASVIADVTLRNLLDPSRCARLVEQHRNDVDQMGIHQMLDVISETVFKADADPRMAELRRQVQRVYVERLIDLAQDGRAAFRVRAGVNASLRSLEVALGGHDDPHAAELVSLISRHLDRPFVAGVPTGAADPQPPGSPIGTGPDFGDCVWTAGAGRQ